jgi:hypothetical protein
LIIRFRRVLLEYADCSSPFLKIAGTKGNATLQLLWHTDMMAATQLVGRIHSIFGVLGIECVKDEYA